MLNYNGKACRNVREEVCPEVYYTNEDRLKELTLEEMTIFLNRWATGSHVWRTDYGETKAWLQEPFDGWIDWEINNG
jgi:hypothetical protein